MWDLEKKKSLNIESLSFSNCKMEVILIMGYFDGEIIWGKSLTMLDGN